MARAGSRKNNRRAQPRSIKGRWNLGTPGKLILAILIVGSLFLGVLVGSIMDEGKGRASEPAVLSTPAATRPTPTTVRPAVVETPVMVATQPPTKGPTPTPEPTPVPLATIFAGYTPEAPEPLFVAILTKEPRFRAGEKATLEVQTMPNAQAKIAVFYGSQAATDKGLEPKTADRTGKVTWSWTVPAGIRGPGRAVVTVSLRGSTQSAETAFTVE